ncbi:hypothetical protein PAXRUDRAFT_171389 [Paxillus rubicundulus Ve08.2h10]|uniref:Secreted protein n=1 Tax=Paxillus rubicundulus Ve08.2h10 TaxID=930991 RepID=A0A0D0BXD2_9AGAM|nr:hypothetical protein PAXRUDRAFT_171389 [Paxillus rubicundulus Ve08.2h10]
MKTFSTLLASITFFSVYTLVGGHETLKGCPICPSSVASMQLYVACIDGTGSAYRQSRYRNSAQKGEAHCYYDVRAR